MKHHYVMYFILKPTNTYYRWGTLQEKKIKIMLSIKEIGGGLHMQRVETH